MVFLLFNCSVLFIYAINLNRRIYPKQKRTNVTMNRSSMTLQEKISLLDDAKNGMDKFMLAHKYNCDKSTVYRIKREEKKLRNMAQNMNWKRKRNRMSAHANIEQHLNRWVKREQDLNRVLTRETVSRAAQEIANRLQSNFVPSSTWIWRWSKRINIKLTRSNKETEDAPEIDNIDSIFEGAHEEIDVKPSPSVLNEHHDSSSHEFQDSFEEVLLEKSGSDGNDIEYDDGNDDMFTCGKVELTENDYEPPPAVAASRVDRCKASSSSTKKHSWLSQLVLTQIESIHPDDRGDFAWEVHKLIRKYQQKKKMRTKEKK